MVDLQTRFDRVVAFVEGNLEAELDIPALANVACLSKYHFLRQFTALYGLSAYSLVKLLRLKRAAYQLAYRRELKVIDIALKSGYESPSAFSRAFTKVFVQSPLRFRQSPDWRSWHISYNAIYTLRSQSMKNNTRFDVQVVDFPEIEIAAFEHRGSPDQLGVSLRQFIQWRKQNGFSPAISRTFNLVYDDLSMTPPEDYRFDIACSLPKRPVVDNPNIVRKVIPAGRCAVVRHTGSDDAISAVANYLYAHWAIDKQITLRDFPLFFERVRFFPDVPEKDAITDVYLPVE